MKNCYDCNHCEVCKWIDKFKDKGVCDFYENEPCGDLISRQAVLDIVDSYSESQSNVEDITQDIISDIMVLSSVKQEPKTDVLDKIRNEFIIRYPRNYANELELGGRNSVFSLNEILRIIDKYRKE